LSCWRARKRLGSHIGGSSPDRGLASRRQKPSRLKLGAPDPAPGRPWRPSPKVLPPPCRPPRRFPAPAGPLTQQPSRSHAGRSLRRCGYVRRRPFQCVCLINVAQRQGSQLFPELGFALVKGVFGQPEKGGGLRGAFLTWIKVPTDFPGQGIVRWSKIPRTDSGKERIVAVT